MIFTFWVSDGLKSNEETSPPSTKYWHEKYPEIRVFSDHDVIPILQEYNSRFVETYKRIRIPACKSDLARLLLLYKYGGLYVDSHAGPGTAEALVSVLDKLSNRELVLFDKTWEHRHPGDLHIINSAICARNKSKILKLLIDSAIKNLNEHDEKENHTKLYVPYNIFTLTGAWDISVKLFDRSAHPIVIKPDFENIVTIFELKHGSDPGFILYKHYNYRKDGLHWSERQQKERLFEPRLV